MIPIADVMTPDPVTVSPQASLADATALMARHRIRHLPVLDGGRLVGLVTQRDALAATDSRLRDPADGIDPHRIPVGRVMTREVVSVDVHDPLVAAARLMERHRYGCLPVRDGERLVGIVTDTDFVAVAINLIEQLEALTPPPEEELALD